MIPLVFTVVIIIIMTRIMKKEAWVLRISFFNYLKENIDSSVILTYLSLLLFAFIQILIQLYIYENIQ